MSNARTWPVASAEYGTYNWFRREIGSKLMFGADYNTWDHAQIGFVDSIVQSGVMNFYFPPPQEQVRDKESGEEDQKDSKRRKPYTWSFLNIRGMIEVTENVNTVDLPADFAGPTGDLTLATGEGRLPLVGEGQLETLSLKNTTPGTPEYAAIRPQRADKGGHQKWELLLYPTPDETMSVSYRYTIVPEDLSEQNQYPLGGRQHAETILQSCLAVAEERDTGQQGPAQAKFIERLAASIHLDKRTAPSIVTTWKSSGDDSIGNSIKSLAGLHMGFGQNEDAWTESQTQQVLEAMRQGLRRFYVPPALPGKRYVHNWSFLKPIATLNLVGGQYEYDLPADFGGLDSPMTYAPGTNVIYPDIEIVGEHQIRKLQQATVQANGRPTKAGFRQKSNVKEAGTGYELLVWPVPDDDYELHYRYDVTAGQDMTVVHGGDAHFQTILEAVKAAADVIQRKKNKPHEALFMERLAASVMYDQQLSAPRTMGYNRDGSNYKGFDQRHRSVTSGNVVTYNGNVV